MKIILIILLISLSVQIHCGNKNSKFIRKYYNNILTVNGDALISSIRNNGIYDNPFRNNPYYVNPSDGYMWTSPIGTNITINLLQQYELNTLKFRLYDIVSLKYNISIYVIYKKRQTLIFESENAYSMITIKFETQFVEQILFYNRGGNNFNPQLHILKLIAFYKSNIKQQ